MTRPGSPPARGWWVFAVLAIAWTALGLWTLEEGEMWRGAAAVALGAPVGVDVVVAELPGHRAHGNTDPHEEAALRG